MLGIEEARRVFESQGYLVLNECLLQDEQLSELETECGRICEETESPRLDCIYEPVSPEVLKRFPRARDSFDEYARLRSVWPCSDRVVPTTLLSERIQSIVHAVIPEDARLFNEQYIVKPSHSGSAGAFGWHRDCDGLSEMGIRPEDVMYVSLWIALDDVTEENGCLVVRPMTGSEEVCIEIPRGSGVLMSHLVEHKSGPNRTQFQRRAWMLQFSRGPILHACSLEPIGLCCRLASNCTLL